MLLLLIPAVMTAPSTFFTKNPLPWHNGKPLNQCFFLFKKHPRNIHFFLHIWYGRIQFNDFPRWQHVHQQQAIDCGHNLLTWISLLKTAGLGVPGFPEEVPGLGGSREGGEGGEGGEGDEIAGNNNDNDNSLTVLQGHPEFSWIFGTLWSVDGLNCLLWMFPVFFWICFPYILKTGGWIPVSTGGNPAVSSTCRENFLKNLLQTFCPEVGDEDKGKKRRGRTYRILFHQVARRGNRRGWKSNQSLKLKAK